jgi:putative oxidoreductase
VSGFQKTMISLMSRIPHDLIALVARIAIGTIFLRSGILKIQGWASGNTLALFKHEYQLPILPPELAAYMATAAELALPPLLIAGLFTRYAALALLAMTLVIQIFVYPNAFDTHGVWAASLLYLMKHGAGAFALDRFIESTTNERSSVA